MKTMNHGSHHYLNQTSGEIESLLFALQAAIGAGVIGFGLGYLKGKKKVNDEVNDKHR